MRDLSQRQFEAACARQGFKKSGFLGYYEVANGVSVSIKNTAAGRTRRANLLYLIEQAGKIRAEDAERDRQRSRQLNGVQ